MTATISRDAKVSRNDWVLFSEVGNGISLMDIESGKFYHFERTSARIWMMLDEAKSINELCGDLEKEFAVDSQTCIADTEAFVAELLKLKLVDLQASERALSSENQ